MNLRRFWRRLYGIVLSVGLAGCATVHIKKVPLDDSNEEGLRFYRPRPYLAINKPVPISGGDFFAYGYLDAKNRLVRIQTRTIPAVLRGYFPSEESSEFAFGEKLALVPFAAINLPAAGKDPTQPKTGAGKQNPPGSTSKPTTKAATQATTQEQSKASFESSTMPGEPLLKVNSFFNVIYLPDFDENYVVRVDSGLGMGSADVELKYGWLVEHAKWNVDNREIGKFLMEQIETAESVGLSFINPVAGMKPAADALGKMSNQQFATGQQTTILLRIRYILEAEPGIYPILKPGESIGSWRSAVAREQNPGRQPPPTGFYPDLHAEEQYPEADILLPVRPYTVVASHYRRVVVVELANPIPQQQPVRPPKPPTSTHPSTSAIQPAPGSSTIFLNDSNALVNAGAVELPTDPTFDTVAVKYFARDPKAQVAAVREAAKFATDKASREDPTQWLSIYRIALEGKKREPVRSADAAFNTFLNNEAIKHVDTAQSLSSPFDSNPTYVESVRRLATQIASGREDIFVVNGVPDYLVPQRYLC